MCVCVSARVRARARVRVREGVKGWMGYRDGRVEGWRDGKGGRVEGWRDGGVEGRSLVPMTRGGQRGPPGMTPGPPKIAQNCFPGRMKKCPSTLAPVSRTAVARAGRGKERREKTGMHGGGREG